MYRAIPYRTWPLASGNTGIDTHINNTTNTAAAVAKGEPPERIRGMVSENPVLVVGRRGCCMCHVVKRLLQGLGVNPVLCEVAEDEQVSVVRDVAGVSADGNLQFPAIFIGGRLVGGLDRLVAVHISGDLVPILKQAGALWL